MDFDPAKLARQMLTHGQTWADENSAAELLEEIKPTLRSQIAMKFLPEVGSVSKADLMAQGSQEYRDHICLMVEARKRANRARVAYDADRTFIDLIRSQQATERATLTLR